jgi:hypothetical protein
LGETLFIHLNGHGVHSGGADYLVPSDADPRYDPFADHCVAIDVNRDIERSRAGDVVVFIDACREGFGEGLAVRTKRVGPVGWSEGTIGRVANRKTAYVFACSKGEYARFVRTGEGAFSIFSRALGELVADEYGPSTLAEFETALQVRVDRLAEEYRTKPQRIRVLTESDTATFVVVARGGQQRSRLVRVLAELTAEQAAALERDGHIRPRIAGLPALPTTDVKGMRAELDDLDRLATDGRWREAGPLVVALSARISRAVSGLQGWRGAAEQALLTRNEMRAEVDAYEQAAAHHGLAEDPVLCGLRRTAVELLYSGGCDLVLARQAVDCFRIALFGAEARWSAP